MSDDVQVVQVCDLVTGSVAFVGSDGIGAVLEKWLPHMTEEAHGIVAAVQECALREDWWRVEEHAARLNVAIVRL